MQINANGASNNVVALDAARARRRYIDLAGASEHWQQVKASFALEGIDLGDDHAERAGRMIAGVATCEQIMAELRQHYRGTQR